jgi:hypothetical protein
LKNIVNGNGAGLAASYVVRKGTPLITLVK